MAETKKTADVWFGRLQKEITGKVENFVATLFFLIAIGAFIGITVSHIWPAQTYLAILLPAAAGLVAYYDRAFALIIFAIFVIMVFI